MSFLRARIRLRGGTVGRGVAVLPVLLLLLSPGCKNVTLSGYMREGEKSLSQNRPDRAREAFEKAAQASGNDPDTLFRIAGAYYRAGRFQEMSPWLNRLSKVPLKPEMRDQTASLYMMTKQLGRACEEWKQAVTEAPKNGGIVNNYVYSCLVEPGKDLDTAITLLNQAVESTGRAAHVVDSLGWAHYQRFQRSRRPEDLERAIELLREAVRKEPGSSVLDTDPGAGALRYHLGRAYMAAGAWDDAYVELMKATSLDPTLEDAKAALAEVQKHRTGS
jgi:Tfp pilus assembly protein PilF